MLGVFLAGNGFIPGGPGGSSTDPGGVAFTGADVLGAFTLLLLLVLAGVASIAAGRRRRHRSDLDPAS